jgi:hypothetical protein
VNFAFVVVLVAAATGIASQLALASVSPSSGPTLGLFVMAVALLGTARWQGKKKGEGASAPAPGVEKPASQSLAPV